MLNIEWIYAIVIAGILTGCLLIRAVGLLNERSRHFLCAQVRRTLFHTHVCKRFDSSADLSIFSLLVLIAFLAGNIICLTYGLPHRIEVSRRASRLAMIHLLPAFLGSRTNVVLDRLFRARLCEMSLIHNWTGRVCLLHVAIHATFRAQMVGTLSYLLISSVAALALLSLLPVRLYVYELFKSIHNVAAAMFLSCIWIHVPLENHFFVAILATTTTLWLSFVILRIAVISLRDPFSVRVVKFETSRAHDPESPQTHSERETELVPGAGMSRMWVNLRTEVVVAPGQYFYVCIPSVPNKVTGCLHWHPYMVLWEDTQNGHTQIEFLLQPRSGFSKRVHEMLFDEGNLARMALLDGPYGVEPQLDNYDKLLYLASGVGITSCLLSVRELLSSHDQKTARARRISVAWQIDGEAHYQLIRDLIEELLARDRSGRQILNISTFDEQGQHYRDEGNGLFKHRGRMPVSDIVQKEWDAEAGNMAIIVCAQPDIEREVRSAVRKTSAQGMQVVHSLTSMTKSTRGQDSHNDVNQPIIERLRMFNDMRIINSEFRLDQSR